MVQVVLVDQTHEVEPTFLHSVAIALDQQVTKDLSSVWAGISANVSSAPSLAAVPPGAWPIFLVKTLPPGEGGYHLDRHNQPYAKVIASAGDESWTIDASHELIEMLVDPYGNRMHSSQAIEIAGGAVIDAQGVFNYLVEACDPCEANNFAYSIGGIAVSDFITPNFYDASVTPGTAYSFKGAITQPRQLLPGGYISYVQPDGRWNQILWVDPGPPVYKNPEIPATARSMRLEIHRAMGKQLDAAKHLQRRKENGWPQDVKATAAAFSSAREGRGRFLRRWYELTDD